MNMWISWVPNVVVALLMLATVVVVFVTVWRTIQLSCGHKTAIALALGVTILAVIGTAQIIFVPLAKESPSSSLPSGGALLLYPVITLAVARLLSELLVAAGGVAPSASPRQSPRKEADVAALAEPHADSPDEGTPEVKRRGRWKRQTAESPLQGHLDDLKKKEDLPKQQQGARTESVPKQTAGKPTA